MPQQPQPNRQTLLPILAALMLWTGAAAAAPAVTVDIEDSLLRDSILAYMRLDNETCETPEWRVRRLFAAADTEIRDALEVVGYYNVTVESSLQQNDACWEANFHVEPGQPVLLRTVAITIATSDLDSGADPQLQQAVKACGLVAGEVLRHSAYDDCKRSLTRKAKDRGYFEAKFSTRQIDVYPDELAADITLHMQTGPRYVFGATTYDQNVLDQDLIDRFVDIEPGTPYDAEYVRRLQRDLISSTYFDQVLFTPAPRGAPYFDVPLRVELTAGKKYQYSAGVGFATDLGPKLRGGILNRRLNKAGHQGEVEINLSSVISDIGASYRLPLDKPRDWITVDTGYKLEDNDSFNSALFTAGAQRVQRRSDDWVRTLFLQLRLEDYEAGTLQNDYSKLLTPGIGYASIQEDYPPRPQAGHRTSVQLRGSVEGLISDTSFLQVYGTTKWVVSLWPGARLLTRADAGFTAINEFRELPASVRFFAGGDTSVRGYGYNTLGPTDFLGEVIGGSNLLVGSIELDHEVYGNWSLAAFIDSGNAYDDFGDFDPATGVGAGIRWFSPLGPIRIDIAFPLDSDAPDNYRLHITLGPDL